MLNTPLSQLSLLLHHSTMASHGTHTQTSCVLECDAWSNNMLERDTQSNNHNHKYMHNE